MANAKFNLLGAEVRAALERLIDVLADLGLAYRQGDKVKLWPQPDREPAP
ncbi:MULTISPECIES: hypothetical protein [Bradyrhizobium]|nr:MULTISPECIES: hypothetical protein [Bradyrhizobium]